MSAESINGGRSDSSRLRARPLRAEVQRFHVLHYRACSVNWGEPRAGIRFRVGVYIVDDTYWDDGNRTTSRAHDFAKLDEAFEFLTTSRKEGCYETVSGVTGKTLRRHLDPDAFCLYQYTEGWRQVADDELLTLLSLL